MSTPHVRSYDSLESMFADMQRAEAAAWDNTADEQRALLKRTEFCWVRPMPDLDCFVFGRFDKIAWLETEKGYWLKEHEDEREPWDQVVARFESRVARGYLSGRAYSVLEPRGELGDTHVSTVYEITEQAFEQARADQWVISPSTRLSAPTLWMELVDLGTKYG